MCRAWPTPGVVVECSPHHPGSPTSSVVYRGVGPQMSHGSAAARHAWGCGRGVPATTYRGTKPRVHPQLGAEVMTPEAIRGEAILAVAAQVFLAYGYEQSSMDEIALEAGVARRTLYNQFSNKKALFDATMAEMWNATPVDAIIEATEQMRPPEDVLFTIGRTIANFWAPPEAVAFMRLVIWESARFPELGESFLQSGHEPVRQAVSRFVQQLSHEDGFSIDDPDFASAQFVNVILGEVLVSRLVATSTVVLDEKRCDYVVREAVTLFMTRYHRRA